MTTSHDHRPYEASSRDADTRGERAERTCLYCGRLFMSQHKGNRRCQKCKEHLESTEAARYADAWRGRSTLVREVGDHV